MTLTELKREVRSMMADLARPGEAPPRIVGRRFGRLLAAEATDANGDIVMTAIVPDYGGAIAVFDHAIAGGMDEWQ